MPMTLNVGLSRKIGQPDYGSLGASCHVEVELDGSLIRDDLEKFHTHVKNAFIACRQAVQDELARHQNGGGASLNGESHANGGGSNGAAGDGHTGNGNSNCNMVSSNGSARNGSPPGGNSRNGGNRNAIRQTSSRRTNPRRATVSQVRAIHAIAGRLGLDLVAELRERFHVDQPDELSISDASRLIDDLKAAPSGAGDGR